MSPHDYASDRGSITVVDKVGLLACNTFRRPSRSVAGTVGITGESLAYTLLTVARQLVICTRFPVTSRKANLTRSMKNQELQSLAAYSAPVKLLRRPRFSES
jgi:hypothetical protein